ncbi:M48 family metalloprotease [Halorubraceae archaeon YAN]|nr:M48 family metalloprotease [Halorubraceae archaeon YAN]
MHWEPNRQLQLRIITAVVLIALLPFAFVYTFVFAMNTIGIVLLEALTERPWPGEFYIDPVFLSILVVGGIGIQLRYGSNRMLSSLNARVVDANTYPSLHARVTRLAWQAGIPAPTVAVARNSTPNAFAVGSVRGPGTVVVTTGLLETLTDEQLDSVLAHEIAHLANRDATVMTVAWILPTITYYLALAAGYVLYGLARIFGSGGVRSRGSGDGRAIVVAIGAIIISALVTLAISALFWVASVLMHRVISRYREYAADRAAVSLTGDPLALASALETIDGTMSEIPDADLRALDGGTEALYFAPLEARTFDSAELVSTDIFPDTHPKTRSRIQNLRSLAGEVT